MKFTSRNLAAAFDAILLLGVISVEGKSNRCKDFGNDQNRYTQLQTDSFQESRTTRKLLQSLGTSQYSVQPGDTLLAIASAHGISLQQLENANPQITNPDQVNAGDIINLPANGVPSHPAVSPAVETANSPAVAAVPSALGNAGNGTLYYQVQQGEGLLQIASKFGLSLDQILKANPKITDPDAIVVGQTIAIPISTPAPAPAPAPAPGVQAVYQVKQGDTLASIALQFGTTPGAIAKLNPGITDINQITIGQELLIPNSSVAIAPPAPARHSSSNTGAIIGGIVGGVVGAALVLGLVFLLIRRKGDRQDTLPTNWSHSGPQGPDPFSNMDSQTTANTNVDVLFRTPKLPSLRSSKKRSVASPDKQGLMEYNVGSTSTMTDSNLDDSAMVADISALDNLRARKINFDGLQNQPLDTVTVESEGGGLSLAFKGEQVDGQIISGPLSETWKIDSSILQCRVKDGIPVRLGKGGGGSVYLGILLRTTTVAIKVVERPTLKEQMRFEREIELLKACHHPNVIQFLGANIRPDKTFLVMEFCPEGDLFNHINRDISGQFLWPKRGRSIALDIARGLTYLHSRSIVHLDIKSPNILLTSGFGAKISDIGLGKVVAGNLGSEGPAGASYWWSPPEQLFGDACSPASDIYSFGVVLWELCTGEQPIERRLRELRVPAEAPQSIADLVTQCREHNPEKRPSAINIHAAIQQGL